ncbi:MAG: hypothetical protein U0793_31780 [Gemmataceae bacterium]
MQEAVDARAGAGRQALLQSVNEGLGRLVDDRRVEEMGRFIASRLSLC